MGEEEINREKIENSMNGEEGKKEKQAEFRAGVKQSFMCILLQQLEVSMHLG